jgi:hypothetical protein
MQRRDILINIPNAAALSKEVIIGEEIVERGRAVPCHAHELGCERR